MSNYNIKTLWEKNGRGKFIIQEEKYLKIGLCKKRRDRPVLKIYPLDMSLS